MQHRIHQFSGTAIGFSGVIRRIERTKPIVWRIPAQSVAAIPFIGGHSFDEVNGKQFADRRVCFDRAHSEVFGDYDPPEKVIDFTHGNHADNDLPATAYAEASVTNLSIVNGPRKLSIGELGFRMSVRDPRDGSAPRFLIEWLKLDNFSIDGTKFDIGFVGCARVAGFSGFAGAQRGSSGYEYGSVVSGVDYAAGCSPLSYVRFGGGLPPGTIVVDELGTIHLGEIFSSPHRWRISMLRIAAGSDDGAGYDSGTGDLNGIGHP